MAAGAILKLSQAGFTEAQVAALAEYFDTQMATKADLAAAEARLTTEIEKAQSSTIKWVVGVGFAQIAMILAVLKLFPSAHP